MPQAGPFSAVAPSAPMDSSKWGTRPDGSAKGRGFLGPLVRPDGGVSTEISMGSADVIDGAETEIPLLVPTLTADEVRYLLSAPPGDWENPTLKRIAEKAVDFARDRHAQGKPFFADYGEQNTRTVLPDLPRYETPDRAVPSHPQPGAFSTMYQSGRGVGK